MRRWFPWLLALAGSLLAPQAFALSLLVTYDLSQTTVTLNAGIASVSIPPQGTISGKIQVLYTSDAAGDILNGPATLEAVDVNASLNINTTLDGLGPFTATGPAQGTLDAPVAGTLSGSNGTDGKGATLSFGGNQGTFTGSTTLTCGPTGGTICALIGATPTKTFSGMGSVPIPDLTLGSIHGDIASFGIALGLGSISQISVDLSVGGQVTSMQLVPEPSSLLLLTGGLLGIAMKRGWSKSWGSDGPPNSDSSG